MNAEKSRSPVLEFDKGSGPNGETLEGTWFGEPGDPITDDLCQAGMANLLDDT